MTLLEALKKIKRDGPKLPEFGICVNVDHLAGSSSGLWEEICTLHRRWPEGDGTSYPVTHPSISPKRAYYVESEDNMWNPAHPYGAVRLRLLDWAIAQLEKEQGE